MDIKREIEPHCTYSRDAEAKDKWSMEKGVNKVYSVHASKHLLLNSPFIFDVGQAEKESGRRKQKEPATQNIKAPALNAQALISSASRTNETCDCVCWGACWQTLQRKGSFKS